MTDIFSFVGKRVRTSQAVRVGPLIIPAGWEGECIAESDNGVGRRRLKVVLDATGATVILWPEEVIVIE